MSLENLSNSPFIPVLIVILVIGFFLYRQIVPRKISMKGLLIIPVILAYFVVQSFTSFHPTAAQIIEIAITSVVSVVLGILACRQLKVYEGPSGKAMAKSSWTYFLWWLGAFVVKSFLAILFGETSFTTVSQTEILLPILILLSARNIYIYMKVKKLELRLH